ncbi:hypothetical protein EDC01DRAFT_745237 [Geopyxis carbonaria]|nr:hypothetical protein EDC01DRAFT_745237 [Geopyxis carbonaria]
MHSAILLAASLLSVSALAAPALPSPPAAGTGIPSLHLCGTAPADIPEGFPTIGLKPNCTSGHGHYGGHGWLGVGGLGSVDSESVGRFTFSLPSGIALPTGFLTGLPTGLPSRLPTGFPIRFQTGLPTSILTGLPTALPTGGASIGVPIQDPVSLPTVAVPEALSSEGHTHGH